MSALLSYERGETPLCFLKSTLGRSLGVHGADAQRLGFYLLANPYLDPRGRYALPLKAMTQHTAIKAARIKPLLRLLRSLGFCRYDFEKEWVAVPLVGDVYGFGLGSAYASSFSPQPVKEEKTHA